MLSKRKTEDVKKSNHIGTWGFILAFVALFIHLTYALGWVIWGLALLLSFAGVFKSRKGLAVVGLVLSLAGHILFVFFASVMRMALQI